MLVVVVVLVLEETIIVLVFSRSDGISSRRHILQS